jgi:hypothetical protein
VKLVRFGRSDFRKATDWARATRGCTHVPPGCLQGRCPVGTPPHLLHARTYSMLLDLHLLNQLLDRRASEHPVRTPLSARRRAVQDRPVCPTQQTSASGRTRRPAPDVIRAGASASLLKAAPPLCKRSMLESRCYCYCFPPLPPPAQLPPAPLQPWLLPWRAQLLPVLPLEHHRPLPAPRLPQASWQGDLEMTWSCPTAAATAAPYEGFPESPASSKPYFACLRWTPSSPPRCITANRRTAEGRCYASSCCNCGFDATDVPAICRRTLSLTADSITLSSSGSDTSARAGRELGELEALPTLTRPESARTHTHTRARTHTHTRTHTHAHTERKNSSQDPPTVPTLLFFA